MSGELKPCLVEQCDRDAVLALLDHNDPAWWAISTGRGDTHSLVRAFAKHRLAALNTRAPAEPHPIPVTEEQSRVLNEALFASFDSVEPPHPAWHDMGTHNATAPVLVWYEWPDGTRITDKAEIDRHGRWVGSEGIIEPQGWMDMPPAPEREG